jgi:hypothetical protein
MFQVFFTLIAVVAASVHLCILTPAPEQRSCNCGNLPAVSVLLLRGSDGNAYCVCTRLPPPSDIGVYRMGDEARMNMKWGWLT